MSCSKVKIVQVCRHIGDKLFKQHMLRQQINQLTDICLGYLGNTPFDSMNTMERNSVAAENFVSANIIN